MVPPVSFLQHILISIRSTRVAHITVSWYYMFVWIFSVCRIFGIPCRSVTNFDSAHDTDKSLTIDVMNKDIGGEMTNISGDSIW